ncbi:MAG: glycoside hydrolase family 31 protein [Actinomycetota bacterium]|nr:glycoside hydrolase family 31 protein [Actinomycetota bacterium]
MSPETSASAAAGRMLSKARLAVGTIRDLGLKTAAGVVAATARQEREALAARLSSRGQDGVEETGPGPMQGFEAGGGGRGAVVRFAKMALEAVFLAPDVVRLSWGEDEAPVPYLVCDTPWEAPPVEIVQAGTGPGGEEVTLTTESMGVAVSADGSVRIRDAHGRILRREGPPTRRGPAWTARAWLRSGERVHGLGEQAAPLDLRGTRHRLYNRDPGGAYGPGQDPTYCGVPAYMGVHESGSYLVFYESSHEMSFSFGAIAEMELAGGLLRSYVMVGPPETCLDRFTAITGRPPLPPRWALGYHQCRWGYRTEADVRAVVEGFHSRSIPLSAIHLDIDYMDAYKVFTVDTERFPDLRSLASDLHARGTHLVTIIDCGVKVDESYPVFRQGRDGGHFCLSPEGELATGVVWPGSCAFCDVTDPAARSWWGGLYGPLLDAGVDGIWHDMNEPTSMTLWGDRTLPRRTRHVMEGRGGDHAVAHNLFGLLLNRAGFEGIAAKRPERRPWILSRSGWASVQRYAWNWTGDVECTWEAMRQQIPTLLALGLSGIPYSGADIGGFSGSPDPELYLRWLQMSICFPLCRTHSALGTRPREPWEFAPEIEARIAELVRLRQRLVPYLYTLAFEASRTGHPLVRPLFWGAPLEGTGPAGLGKADDAYFCGNALLVAPVLSAGERSRSVLLPPGSFYELRLDAPADDGPHEARRASGDDRMWEPADLGVRDGPATIAVDAPLARLPVFVRAGAIVPVGPPRLPVGADAADEVTLHCYLDRDGSASGALYRDAGDGYGPGVVDGFAIGTDGDGRLVLHWATEHLPPRQAVGAAGGEGVAGLDEGAPAAGGVRLVVHGAPGGPLRRASMLDGSGDRLGAPIEAVGGVVELPQRAASVVLELSPAG